MLNMETEEPSGENAYYGAFDGIIAALDALAKTLTVDTGDDATPPDATPPPERNTYFASFREMASAIVRVKDAMSERLAALAEQDPAFKNWRDESYTVGIGKDADSAAHGIAIGWNSSAGSGTGVKGRDAGAVAVGKTAGAWGIDAVAIGRNANAGSSAARTTIPTVQLGAGANLEDGTLQFRDWQLVNAEGTIPKARLPADAGGLVEATGSWGRGDDRTTGLFYAVFSPEALGMTAKSVCVKGISLVCSDTATLAAGDARRLEIKAEDGSVQLGISENEAEFSSAGAPVKFTFSPAIELRAGRKYRLKIIDGTGANVFAPVMLGRTDGSGELSSFIAGSLSMNTSFFPCIGFTVLKAEPGIESSLAGAGALSFAAPAAADGVVALEDRAVNSVRLEGAATAFAFPAAAEGVGRSFLLKLEMAAATAWTLPADCAFESDDPDVFSEVEAGGTAVFLFSETGSGTFMVSRKALSAVSKE